MAYPYLTDRAVAGIRDLGNDCRFLLDSGAFTAWKTGKRIALDDYCRFIDKLPIKPWRYFVLDVVGDPAASLANFETMRARGFDPVPIVTRGDTLDMVDHYLNASGYIAVGGIVAGGTAAKSHVKAIMQRASGRAVHLLGFTRIDWLSYLRPASADSSTWEEAARYGRFSVYLGGGRFAPVQKARMAESRPSEEVIAAIRGLGFDPYALRQESGWRGVDSAARWISAASWIAASLAIERRLDVKLFISLSSEKLDLVAGAYRSVTRQAHGETLRRNCLAREIA
jgi:hypothetical protein